MATISLYCVGIYFYKSLQFPSVPAGGFILGEDILKEAANQGLRYQLVPPPSSSSGTVGGGLLSFLGYTPQLGDPLRHNPEPGTVFPFYGQPLSLIQRFAPIGEISQVLQYTVDGEVQKPVIDRPSFASNSFKDGAEIRIRLLSIYDQT